jgi:hypothetical protein
MSDSIQAILKAELDKKRQCDQAEKERQERIPKVRRVAAALHDFRQTTRQNCHFGNRCDASEEDLSRRREALADAFITLTQRLRDEGEEYRLDGLSAHGPISALAESLYQLGSRGESDTLLYRLKQLQDTEPEFQSQVWQIVEGLTGEILDSSEAMWGAPHFGKHARRASAGADTDQIEGQATISNPSEQPAPNLDPTIQAILDETLDATGAASAQAEAEQAEGAGTDCGWAEAGEPKPPTPSSKEANILVRQYLNKHPNDYSIRKASEATGISTGRICKLPAWLARPPKNAPEVNNGRSNRRERELTEAILASVEVENDPSEQASLRETAWLYLERNAKDESERSRLQKMSETDREEVIALVIEHFDKQIPE